VIHQAACAVSLHRFSSSLHSLNGSRDSDIYVGGKRARLSPNNEPLIGTDRGGPIVRQNAGMLNDADLVAFVATTDITEARRFYAEVLGLTLTEDTPFACVFDAHGTALRVTPVPEPRVAPYTVLGWEVTDMEASIRELAGRGVVFEHFDGMTQDELGIWTTPGGDQVAWFKDPDANLLSLSRHATE
jgi:catechol 2,3-dioxygenase-like lactoylglutathione lyase family enzyme